MSILSLCYGIGDAADEIQIQWCLQGDKGWVNKWTSKVFRDWAILAYMISLGLLDKFGPKRVGDAGDF